jgi:hypothetical protein
MRSRFLYILALAGSAFALGVTGASSAPLPRVTLIGDSVSSAISLDSGATAILGAGIDLQLQAKACRRLAGVSCPESDGTVPPTALALINSLGHALGPTVIMAVGYNDPEPAYQSEIQEALAALHQQGVQHILWMTLRAERHPYLTMNDEIWAAAAADPSVTVVDWNKYSRSHPEWFQPDGIHPAGDGAEAMATLLHRALVDLKIAPGPLTVVAKALPAAHEHERYSASFAAAGGTPPYRWSPVTLPAGFSVTPTGTLEGRPGAHAGVLRLTVRVTDATGTRSARAFVLHVLR